MFVYMYLYMFMIIYLIKYFYKFILETSHARIGNPTMLNIIIDNSAYIIHGGYVEHKWKSFIPPI